MDILPFYQNSKTDSAKNQMGAVCHARPTAYKISEAASLLRMSEKSVRRQIDKGTLRRCKKFGRVLIPCKDVDTFFDRTAA